MGVDTLNAYYDPTLKQARLDWLKHDDFTSYHLDVADAAAFAALIERVRPKHLIHLAAQAGVRYSLVNPFAYERANVGGQLSVLEAVRHARRRPHLIYASSSSVYGDRPLDQVCGLNEADAVDQPASLYAATKRSCELLSGTYAHLYGFGSSGLRLFTVYGPWGRPDMAYFSFAEKMQRGEPIEIYGEGRMSRDFTYIDDIVDGILGLLEKPAADGEHRIFNVGGSHPRGLMEMITILERELGIRSEKIMMPMQLGDVTRTFADTSKLRSLTGYNPRVSLEEGLRRFVTWHQRWRNAGAYTK